MHTAALAMLDKIFDDPDRLPECWLLLRDQAYSNAYLRAAAQAYRAGVFAKAKTYLTEAVRLNPVMCHDGADLLAKQLSAWADDPRTGDRLAYLQTVYDNLPDSLASMRHRRRQDLAQAAMQLAYDSHRRADFASARSAIMKAIRYRPAWLRDRGVVSILMRSIFQSRGAGKG
jgi:hypothetical protein